MIVIKVARGSRRPSAYTETLGEQLPRSPDEAEHAPGSSEPGVESSPLDVPLLHSA